MENPKISHVEHALQLAVVKWAFKKGKEDDATEYELKN